MKRGVPLDPRFRRLARRLELPEYAVAGVLELVWHFAARNAPAGDVGRWDDEDLADAIGWKGDAHALVEALVAERWLAEDPTHRLVVCDWFATADESVHAGLARQRLRFADGRAPKLGRWLSSDERAAARAEYEAAPGDHSTINPPAAGGSPARPSPARPVQGECEGDRANAAASTPRNASRVAPDGATLTPARSRARRTKPEPPAWALAGAEALLEHVRRSPGGRLPKGCRERWAAELARLPAEVPELARGDPGPAVLEAIAWLGSAANAGEFAIVVHSGRALREKWPKIAAARRRAALKRGNGRAAPASASSGAVRDTSAPKSAEELRDAAACERVWCRYGLPRGKAPPEALLRLALRGASDEDLDATAWKLGLCFALADRHQIVSDRSDPTPASGPVAIAALGATSEAPPGAAPRAAHEKR